MLTFCFDFTDVIHKFARDIYYKRFPELESLVPMPIEYMKTVKVGVFQLGIGW